MSQVMVFVPCYNCGPQIEGVIEGLKPLLSSQIHVRIVDNRSQDDTWEKIQAAISTAPLQVTAKVRLAAIQNAVNLGLGGSFKGAVRAAENYEWLVIFHGDGQALHSDLKSLLDLLPETRSDLVVGARFHPQSRLLGYSRRREWANRMINRLLQWISGKPVYETGSGLMAFRLTKAFKAKALDGPDHIAFDLEFILEALRRRETIEYLPITWVEDGQTSTVNDWRVGAQMLSRIFKWSWRGY